MADLTALTIHESADLLRRREVSSRELTSAALDRIAEVDARVHAFLTVTPEHALDQADAADARIAEGDASPLLGVGEHLPFRDGSFDVVVLNEVIEHVQDDAATLREALRVIAPGGHVVIYAPNRLFPFETHGIYLGNRFVFGNIPFVNWLPDSLRNRLVPHARAYTKRGIRKTYAGLPAKVRAETYVYPGFDNIIARRRRLGAFLRAALYRAEHTPLRAFGLSHFVVLEKPAAKGEAAAG